MALGSVTGVERVSAIALIRNEFTLCDAVADFNNISTKHGQKLKIKLIHRKLVEREYETTKYQLVRRKDSGWMNSSVGAAGEALRRAGGAESRGGDGGASRNSGSGAESQHLCVSNPTFFSVFRYFVVHFIVEV